MSANILAGKAAIMLGCPLPHGNIQKETDTEKSIYYDFMKPGDFSTVRNLLKSK